MKPRWPLGLSVPGKDVGHVTSSRPCLRPVVPPGLNHTFKNRVDCVQPMVRTSGPRGMSAMDTIVDRELPAPCMPASSA